MGGIRKKKPADIFSYCISFITISTPRLILRPLASYLAVTYLTVAFLFLTLIFGKSMLGALLILLILFTFGVVVKAFVNPTTEIKTGHNDTTSELFLSDMVSK